jgi:putative oxidoreductase
MNTADLGLLILRLVVGLTFAAHGAQKAFGWWQGSGYAGWHAVVDRMGFRPVPLFAAVSIAAELGGGLALAVGFLTPLAATALIGQSVVIIGKAHWPRGFWNRDNGLEFPLSLAAGVVAILLIGPGAASIDNAIGFALGDTVRLWLLVVGLLGGGLSILVTTVASRFTADGPAAPAR